jgi:RHS repeat-associated protein
MIKELTLDDNNDGVLDRTLQFKYDAFNNRVKKIEISAISTIITYYIRNVSGELISIYEDNGSTVLRKATCTSQGIDYAEEHLSSGGVYKRIIGSKAFELKDQLGNVRLVINDCKEPSSTTAFAVNVIQQADYYSFGSLLYGRNNTADYTFGFNGKERDDEILGANNCYDFGSRIYDARIARFLSLDRYSQKFPHEGNYNFASNKPINAIDINGDSTYLVMYGASYLNFTQKGKSHDVGSGFKRSAEALKRKIENSSGFDQNRDQVVLVYAPSAYRFREAVNQEYESGKIASLTVFSHGYAYSETNGTNTGGASLGGEMPGELRPDGTTVSEGDAYSQLNDYDLRELNGNTVLSLDADNFESSARATFYGCWIGGGAKWSSEDIKSYAFGQRVANNLGITVYAFTGSGMFKTDGAGKNIYDGTMIRAEDRYNQKTKLSTFKSNEDPVTPK